MWWKLRVSAWYGTYWEYFDPCLETLAFKVGLDTHGTFNFTSWRQLLTLSWCLCWDGFQAISYWEAERWLLLIGWALWSKQMLLICALFLLLFRCKTAEIFSSMVPVAEYCCCGRSKINCLLILLLLLVSSIWIFAISQITNISYIYVSVILPVSWREEIDIWGGYCGSWFLSCFCRKVTNSTWVELFLIHVVEKGETDRE